MKHLDDEAKEKLELVIQLKWYEITMIQKALGRAIRKFKISMKKDKDKKWKPEEGKYDINKVYLKSTESAYEKIQKVIETALGEETNA